MSYKYLALLSGILLSISFPPSYKIDLSFLSFISFLPLLLILNSSNNYNFISFKKKQNFAEINNENKSLFLVLYLTFLIYHIGVNWCIGSFQKQTDPYLLMSAILLSIFHPFFFMVPIKIYLTLKKLATDKNLKFKEKIHFLFPFIWVVFEWLHGETELSYPWITLGYTQIESINWIQFIDITGIWGASFIILMINVLIYDLYSNYIKTNDNTFDIKNIITFFNYKRNTILILLFFVLSPFIYSTYQYYNFKFIIEQTKNVNSNKIDKLNNVKIDKNYINFGVIQPNINPWEKWAGQGMEQISNHLNLQDKCIKTLNNSIYQNDKIDLFIWSETAIPFIDMSVNSNRNIDVLKQDIVKNKYSLLTGFTDIKIFPYGINKTITARPYFGESYYEPYNSAMLINPKDLDSISTDNFREKNIYQKMKLTPFAERLPHSELISFAQNWFTWGVGISSWGIGTNQKNLVFENNKKTATIAPIICIESIYPRFVSNFAELGAEIFVIITNDAWYNGTPGPRQHYLIGAARAIENKRFLVRCANSGVSGVISPLGTSINEIPAQTSSFFKFKVPKIHKLTLYSQYGDWFPSLLILCVLGIYIYLKKN